MCTITERELLQKHLEAIELIGNKRGKVKFSKEREHATPVGGPPSGSFFLSLFLNFTKLFKRKYHNESRLITT